MKALGVPKHRIFTTLTAQDTSNIPAVRKDILSKYTAKTSPSLLRFLYPKKRSSFMNTPSDGFDLRAVFQEYCNTEVTAIEPHHLNDLISKFLDYPYFKRPVKLLSGSSIPTLATMHAYSRSRSVRSQYTSMLQKLFADLKQNGLPVSVAEQNKFLYYMFFKDRHDIDDRVQQAFKRKGLEKFKENEFTFSFYKQLAVDDIDSLNNLLVISVMHSNKQVFDDILGRVTPNRKTYMTMLDGYSGPFRNPDEFYAVVRSIDVTMDITLLNKILSGLVRFGNISEAELLLSSIPEQPQTDILYWGLTPGTKVEYDQYLQCYDKLSKITTMPPLLITPNLSTFMPFLEHYSWMRNTPKLFETIDTIRRFGLPLTTRVFTILFENLGPQESIHALYLLKTEFEKSYALDYDLNTFEKPVSHGSQFLKLSDHLLKVVSKAVSANNTDLEKLYTDLREDIMSIRHPSNYTDLFTVNQVTHLKYSFLQRLYTMSLEKTELSPLEVSEFDMGSSTSFINSSKS
ncbi:hypothetical protein PSN45_004163 [Yamadazyma tenuis]|uniref:uncharacterized protein n=1 Tax=Candida tenuis TaxID=2315449 RepID=UPI0027A7DC46|nr:hypothetical protein PSN45_004163 [Yamadazyma tenuis]